MSSVDDPIRIVREGYDRLDRVYSDWVARMPQGQRARFLDEILRLVPRGSAVLELGCGPGTDAASLAEGRRYTGVDLSGVQLEHARATVSAGTFLHSDLFDVELPSASFDAVIAFYVFGHVPASRTGELFARIRGWLRPGGRLYASFGSSDNPGEIEPMWLGAADMYFASVPPERAEALLRDAGFAIERSETITEDEDGIGPATFHWVIVRTPNHEEARR